MSSTFFLIFSKIPSPSSPLSVSLVLPLGTESPFSRRSFLKASYLKFNIGVQVYEPRDPLLLAVEQRPIDGDLRVEPELEPQHLLVPAILRVRAGEGSEGSILLLVSLLLQLQSHGVQLRLLGRHLYRTNVRKNKYTYAYPVAVLLILLQLIIFQFLNFLSNVIIFSFEPVNFVLQIFNL